MDRILGIGSILVLLFIVIYNVKSFKPCISISNQRYENYEEKSEELQDKLSNLFTIYSSGTIDNEINDYKETTKYLKIFIDNLCHVIII